LGGEELEATEWGAGGNRVGSWRQPSGELEATEWEELEATECEELEADETTDLYNGATEPTERTDLSVGRL
jgi:hypothetical protein